MNSKKIVFLNYIPSPYRVDFFNELNKFCDLTVIFYYPGMPNTPWQDFEKKREFKHVFLFEKASKLRGIINLLKLLKRHKQDTIVIGGYAMAAEIIAIFFLKFFKINFILNSDGGFVTHGFFKTILKKRLIQSATYWLSTGVNTTKTLLYYGAKTSNIFEYHFSSIRKNEVLSDVLNDSTITKLKNELKLETNIFYIVFVGQLVQRKGVDVLLKSLAFIDDKKIEIIIIGAGEEENSLKEYLNIQKDSNKVHFLGKLSKDLVLKYLKVSDFFVFPSREDIWGLVLNEAIANGLPIISTSRVGSAYSLISPSKNGFIIDADNPIILAETINRLVLKDLILMKKNSIAIAQKYTIEQMVQDHLLFFNTLKSNI